MCGRLFRPLGRAGPQAEVPMPGRYSARPSRPPARPLRRLRFRSLRIRYAPDSVASAPTPTHACRASRAPGRDGPLASLPARAVSGGESRPPRKPHPSTRISPRRGPPAGSPALAALLTLPATPPERQFSGIYLPHGGQRLAPLLLYW